MYGLDVVDAASTRLQWLTRIGGSYLDGRQVRADHVEKLITHHYAYTDFQAAFDLNVPDAIKVVIEWPPK